LVLSIPTPRCHHRKHQDPALAEQFLISARVVFAYFFGHMGQVELDRPTATSLQVYEQQPVRGPEQIARMRLAVQQLLGSVPLTDRKAQRSQRTAQKLPIRIPELRSEGAVADKPLSLGDAIREVRRSEIDLPHTRVQPCERLRILGWRHIFKRDGLIVGP